MAADTQHKEARNLLPHIYSSVKRNEPLTYNKAAGLLKRSPPEAHSHALGNMCDLLDAAACFAGVPLLAFVWVRSESGKVNPKAWKELEGPLRAAIIKRSEQHSFCDADIRAIYRALDELKPKGNINSWKHVKESYPGEKLHLRLVGYSVETDAIDDLGTDAPSRKWTEGLAYARDQKVRDAVLHRANGKCEFCGELGFLKSNKSPYLETHHIIALAKDGADRPTNVIAVCPNDHRKAHFAQDSEEIESQMIAKVKDIILLGSESLLR